MFRQGFEITIVEREVDQFRGFFFFFFFFSFRYSFKFTKPIVCFSETKRGWNKIDRSTYEQFIEFFYSISKLRELDFFRFIFFFFLFFFCCPFGTVYQKRSHKFLSIQIENNLDISSRKKGRRVFIGE